MNPTHEIHVCDGRSCRSFGGPDILKKLTAANSAGQLPPNTMIFESGCLGPCSSAPNIIVDTEFMQNVDPSTIVTSVQNHLQSAAITPGTTLAPQQDDTPKSKKEIYEDPDMRQPTTRTGLSAEDIMNANNFLGDL